MSGKAVITSADNPDQRIVVHEDGTVRLHARAMDGTLRTVEYGTFDRLELVRLCHRLNELAAGEIGEVCRTCGKRRGCGNAVTPSP